MMANNLHIKTLIDHIHNDPNIKCAGQYFCVDKYELEYGDTEICPKAKEHKLWTPRKNSQYRCFLIIQWVDNNYWLINHVLSADDIRILPIMGNAAIELKPPNTYAAKHGDNDQFKGSIQIGINTISDSKLADLIGAITKATVDRKLNINKKLRG